MNESEADQNMPKKCPQCGASLPAGALSGLCPACLLAQGAAETGPEAAPFQPPGIEEIARLFPQLEILAFIGKGGMGAVYKARQPSLDRFVALKILPPQAASGPGFAERFNREARALAKLNHPNIVAVHEFGQMSGLPFFIMEFVDGLNLRQLEQTGKLSAREALQIVPQICEALQFAHDEGIVHRDIKPENILVDKKGRVKIADFGIAKIMGREPDASVLETRGAIGTPHYMAPEQVEKPQTVDHRADIFSLGVVFYEMLTGELPLGKFAPPSSRRVEVDVRLDEVVLRALEKEPERRYQHVSQVKTAVDTIASTAASPPPGATAGALAQEILARDYTLDIGSCLRRGWALVRSDFWPLVGVSALIGLLIAIVNSAGTVVTEEHGRLSGGGGILGLLVDGPLMGGLYFYFLKKIRREAVTIETAFSGFSSRFLHLFLGSFVSFVLIVLGFFCLILPGIYLTVAWWFTLPLIMDKRLDFWSAMELSRKVVTRHWWKFLGFCIVLLLLKLAGLVVFCIGFLIAGPIVMASLMYAYEDIFGAAGRAAGEPVADVGPAGTQVLGSTPGQAPNSGGGTWRLVSIGAGVAMLLIVAVVIVLAALKLHHRYRNNQEARVNNLASPVRQLVFGPVIERTIQARATGTNQFLDLDTGTLLTPSSEITGVLVAGQSGNDERLYWEALDIPGDSRRFQYIAWLHESGADLMFAGEGRIIGFDAVFPLAHGDSSMNRESWDSLRPEQVSEAVNVVDWGRRASEASRQGQPVPPGPTSGGTVNSAVQLSQYPDGATVNLLTREQSAIWFFKTREGAMGVLQILGFTDDPDGVKIRYKLVQQTSLAQNDPTNAANPTETFNARENLAARLEAAEMMSNIGEKDKSIAAITLDAAKAGEVEIVTRSLQQISNVAKCGETAHESARLLARRGLRKQAIQIANTINNIALRDQALSELAREDPNKPN